jgi:hypothetical protein
MGMDSTVDHLKAATSSGLDACDRNLQVISKTAPGFTSRDGNGVVTLSQAQPPGLMFDLLQ